MALGGAGDGEGAAGLEELALVVQPVDLFGVGEQAGFPVGDDGAVLPGVPVAHDDFHELVGAVVAAVVFAVRGVAHVERLAVVHRGDDVPGGAAVGHQVEGGEDAGDVERLEIGGGEGGAEAEPLGGHAHDGQDGDRVHLHAADAVGDGVGVVAAEQVGHREAVVEEAEVEFPGLQRAADAAVILGAGEVLAWPSGDARSRRSWCSSAPAGSRPVVIWRMCLGSRRRCACLSIRRVLAWDRLSRARVRGPAAALSLRPALRSQWRGDLSRSLAGCVGRAYRGGEGLRHGTKGLERAT